MRSHRLADTFAALADPTRLAILARLSLGETTVTALAEPFEMSLPAVSKHLAVLERAGLIKRGREAQWRPCRLEAGPLRDVSAWLDAYRRFWDESLSRLDAYLQAEQAQGQSARSAMDQSAKDPSTNEETSAVRKPRRKRAEES